MSTVLAFPVAKIYIHKQPINDFSASKRRSEECFKLHRQLTDVFIEAIEFCVTNKALDEVSATHDFAMRSHDPVVVKVAIAKMQSLMIPVVAAPQKRANDILRVA
jgi:hypothetical protein